MNFLHTCRLQIVWMHRLEAWCGASTLLQQNVIDLNGIIDL